jgi:hypothetical protein
MFRPGRRGKPKLFLFLVHEHATDTTQAFLPVVLAVGEGIFNRKVEVPVESDDPEELWGSAWDDLVDWLKASHGSLVFSALVLSFSVFLVANFGPKSTYFCSAASDRSSLVIYLQWAGVIIDAIILQLSWRVLSWAKTTKARLRTLGSILTFSSIAAGMAWLSARVSQHQSVVTYQSFQGLDSIYVFDILSSGITCAIVAVSASLWLCDSTPVALTGSATFISGLWTATQEVLAWGTYREPSRLQPLLVLSIICWGFSIFSFTANMRNILFIQRTVLLGFFIALIVSATVVALFKDTTISRHPANELIYKNRIEADRWLRTASVSTTMQLAVTEYKERHRGREPPANFDKWFEFALGRNSVIIDKFDQIEKDILPFWGLKPSKIQEGLEIVKALPDVGIIKIAGGKASHNEPANPDDKVVLDEAVAMISSFANHLPDMSIAINLRERPRILVPWDDIHRLTEFGSKPKSKLLPQGLTKREATESKQPEDAGGSLEAPPKLDMRPYVSPSAFHHLQALSCPPGSKTRAGVTWNVRDHCASCADPHSQGHFLVDWEYSLDPCHQPDIFHLHEFHTIPHRSELYQDLLPLFSRSKTDSFNDIIMPLIRPSARNFSDNVKFDNKDDVLFWQKEPVIQPITHDSLHGGQNYRFSRLVNSPAASEKRAMLLGTKLDKRGVLMRFEYETVPTRQASHIIPMEISHLFPKQCDDPTCKVITSEHFGYRPEENSLTNRYIMVLDTADGPAPETLEILGSNSVPVISSIFREWYTERLMPWTHFIPIDIRYHGLHSTMAYFFGLKDRGKINGRPQHMEGQASDGRWIAEEGRKWAEKAIRREDMEVYMFRLLLEWGRVINENRDSMVFTLKEQ